MRISAEELWDNLALLEGQLHAIGRFEMISQIEEAKAAGATSLEIYFRVAAALDQIKEALSEYRSPLEKQVDELLSQFEAVIND